MVSESPGRNPYLREVQTALNVLSESLQEPKLGPIQRTFPFRMPEWDGQTKVFPTDDDIPVTNSMAAYVVKQMEFVQTFLVTHRLTKEMEIESLWPLSFSPTEQIAAILDVVGCGKESLAERRRYYPQPHVVVEVDKPFVDFAGFLVIILLDYLMWVGTGGGEVAAAARREVDEAIRFLLDPSTYIEDDAGIGWAFIERIECSERRGEPRLHRHILPTDWATVAIQRYCTLPNADPELRKTAVSLLPRVLEWIANLRTDERMFRSSERAELPTLAGHCFMLEALLALVEAEVPEAEPLALEAVGRFLNELDRPTARDDFEMNIAYPVYITDRPGFQYGDRTTWATCLSTLALTVPFLVESPGQEATVEQVARARTHCEQMARYVLEERRNDLGVWQRNYFQFHWTLTAVEALVRVSRYARREVIETSVDAIVQAVDIVFRDTRFQSALRDALIPAIRRTSMPGPEMDNNLEAET